MLVLTRKAGEGIIIGDDITIKIIELKGGGVRVGIEAPKDRKIYRQELYDKITQANLEASQWSMTDLGAISSNLSTDRNKP
ncbi:MAG: carbon storage regulator CsrA [Proteobacteria bacterium]|nr:carbon storage regulator CsrA [Pseudomonadota bacterium]MBU1059911.1 carbon storage regulator CsrA [Pseudomonadota bacterium]